MAYYDFQTDRVTSEIRTRKARRVLLQFPDGLKQFGLQIAADLEKETGALVYISGDHCYGACDLPLDEATRLDADLIVHYGHAKFELKDTPNVLYVYSESNIDVLPIVQKALSYLEKFTRIGLITTVQHVGRINEMAELLSKHGKEVSIGKPGGHIELAGQVLGCDYTTARNVKDDVEAYLFVGGGDFHPLGAAMATGRPVTVADPYLNEVRDITLLARQTLVKRRGAIMKLVEAKNIGIIVSSKTGQSNYRLAEELKRRFAAEGKGVTLLCITEVTPVTLDNFPELEAFVNTACPRIGMDDSDRYHKPIVSAEDAMAALRKTMDKLICL